MRFAVALAMGTNACTPALAVEMDGLLEDVSLIATAVGRDDGTTEIWACVQRFGPACDDRGVLVASSEGQEVTLEGSAPEEAVLTGELVGALNGNAVGKEIVLSYEGDVVAPETRVLLPAPFTTRSPCRPRGRRCRSSTMRSCR